MTEIPSALFFIADLEALLRRSRQTIRRMWEKGKFPKPAMINNRCAWRAESVQEWINTNLQGE